MWDKVLIIILFIVLSGFIALLFKNNLKTLVTTIWASLGLITCGAFAFLTAGAEKLVEFKISNFSKNCQKFGV